MANTKQLSLFEYEQATNPLLSDEVIVERLCAQLLDEAEARRPVRVEVIASLRGITKIQERTQPWAGMLSPDGATFTVSLRAGDPYERQRFTICHEAAHTLFPGFSEEPHFRCNGARTRLEELCDLAGSELLLPRRYFISDLAQAGFSLDAVEALADGYEASRESTALRSVDLWSAPAMLVVLRERHKPAEAGREADCPPKLRVSYAHASGSWPFVLRHKSVDPDSIFGRAWRGELVSEAGDMASIASASRSVTIDARRYGDRVLALLAART